jgi:hypothetical protein
MSKGERRSGRGAGRVTIATVSVACRWHFSYLEGSESEEDFKFVASLSLAERKKQRAISASWFVQFLTGPVLKSKRGYSLEQPPSQRGPSRASESCPSL